MSTITLGEAQANLAEVIAGLTEGNDLFITDGVRLVAKLSAVPCPPQQPRTPGSAVGATTPAGPVFGLGKGMLTILSDDEEHLLDFAEYM
jgi:antitoxin (DNA-binding transcriptional repressor) of toxin-antitoxin stability system